MRLGLDAMGGDYAPLEVVKGAINYVNAFEKHTIVLFGDETVVQKTLDELGYVGNNIVIVHCAEHIAMHEHGARAVASKKESSINIGMAQHKAGLVDCFISAGNTGAMLAASLFIFVTHMEHKKGETLTLLCLDQMVLMDLCLMWALMQIVNQKHCVNLDF